MLQPDGQDDGHALPCEPLLVFTGLSSVLLFAWLSIVSLLSINWKYSQQHGQSRNSWKYKSLLWLPSKDTNTKPFQQDATKTRGYYLTLNPDAAFPLLLLRGRFCMFSPPKLNFLFFYLHWMAFLKHRTMTLAGRSVQWESHLKAALPPSGAKAAVHQFVARLQARTHGGDEWWGGDEWRGGDRGRECFSGLVRAKGGGSRKRWRRRGKMREKM